MKKVENRRNLVIWLVILAMAFVILIANVVKLNVFALVVDILLVIFICFILGYNYCVYESGKVVVEKAKIATPIEEFEVKTQELKSL